MERVKGFEPSTSSLARKRSSQLSYTRAKEIELLHALLIVNAWPPDTIAAQMTMAEERIGVRPPI